MSNADEAFSNSRLKLCETEYRLFYDHFRRKNLTLYSPAAKLQISMFDSQAGFEAYLDRKMPAEIDRKSVVQGKAAELSGLGGVGERAWSGGAGGARV